MIVVIGAVFARETGAELVPAGLAAGIALAAAAAEVRVELVARIGDDPAGDAVLLAFAAVGVGHVATLRDPARATPIAPALVDAIDIDPDATAEDDAASAEPKDGAPTLDSGDVDLALRYLTDFRVIVVVHPTDSVLPEVIAAADYAGAHLVVVADPDTTASDGSPAAALVVQASEDAAGFGDLLGRYAAAVDRGEAPATAFAMLSGVAGTRQP